MKKVLLLPALLAACSSAPKMDNGQKFEKDQTLSTLNDSSQPNWADESKPFVIQDGEVQSLGIVELKGDQRPEAGMRISENNARANLSKAITNRMEFVFQNAEENTDADSTTAKFIGSEMSSLTSHSIRVKAHWYKRYMQTQEDGSHKIKYRIYSLVTIPETDFKKALSDAVTGAVNEHKISSSFQEQVNKQYDKFIAKQE